MENSGGLAEGLSRLQADGARVGAKGQWATMVSDDVWRRLRAANRRDTEAWRQVQSRSDWEAFRDARLVALRRSLGQAMPVPDSLHTRVTGTVAGEGFTVENIVFESRPGLLVTANLYLPEPPGQGMPGIIICHSHHNPKTQGELQDMGMNWARQGALVLVMDQLGHGERRQQPFGGRQDYISRSVMGMQLHLVGESLIGWMVWDLMRGVDLLLARPDVDPDRVIMAGSVAGGGDPAAVAAALDGRIKCAIPFNFGGPQPETPYPLPEDAEDSFNYAGIPELESTRCLRRNAQDGFLPWVIVAAIAPRHLIYGHEFSWDRERDPVWRRLQRVFGFYGAGTHLAFAHGRGVLSGRPPEASHCNNIGPLHRSMIYPALERWFGMATPEPEYQHRLPAEGLTCLPEAGASQLRKVHELTAEMADAMVSEARAQLTGLSPAARRERLRVEWAQLLGDIVPHPDAKVLSSQEWRSGDLAIRQVVLESEPGIQLPMLLLHHVNVRPASEPVVVGVAQRGKAGFLRARRAEIEELLHRGVTLCLPDLRGTGESATDDARGLRLTPSEATVISPAELMLGQTMVGRRLRDLRTVLHYLRTELGDGRGRLAIWGDSFAPLNPDSLVDPPAGSEHEPHRCEPLGAMLALLAALFEDDVAAVAARRGLVGLASVLSSPFAYVPHDVIVPGVLRAGDLSDVAAALAPRPLRLEGLVDGRNRAVPETDLEPWLQPVRAAYSEEPSHLCVAAELETGLAAWFETVLREAD